MGEGEEESGVIFFILSDDFFGATGYPAQTFSQLLVPTHLQDPAADVSVTCLTFNAKLGVVVGLAVWNAIPARGNPHKKRKLGGPEGEVEIPRPAADGDWAKIRSTGELVESANSPDTPQIYGIR